MCYYTWSSVPPEQVERVKGKSPYELLWDDSLGAGLQMACFDVVGKMLATPVWSLMGDKVRERCTKSKHPGTRSVYNFVPSC